MPHLPQDHPISKASFTIERTYAALDNIITDQDSGLSADQEYYLRLARSRVARLRNRMDQLAKERERMRSAFMAKCTKHNQLRARYALLMAQNLVLRQENARLRNDVAPPPPIPIVTGVAV